MKLSFKNRIALYYLLATASMVTVVFVLIYFVVQTAVYQELDDDLSYEAHKHSEEIFLRNDSIFFKNKNEWAEREHREVRVNPVFIQLVNNAGKVMDKSPNLMGDALSFDPSKAFDLHFDTGLNQQEIRQIQLPIKQDAQLKGYILAAMSLEGPKLVLASLKKLLLWLFPAVLAGLFFITRFLAGQSIKPVQLITSTTNRITQNSLDERIALPAIKDELFTLTSSINELLERIQNALEREQQFTADASHQLRTPLAVLKGTLEVTLRRPRTPEEYQEKIKISIQEIDRLSVLADQLLLLARFDSETSALTPEKIQLLPLVNNIVKRYQPFIEEKKQSIKVEIAPNLEVNAAPYYLDLIFENLLTNASKYSPQGKEISIRGWTENGHIKALVIDQGMGIPLEHQEQIFHPFFRSKALDHKDIKGNGLGLSIVKKACAALGIKITVESTLGKGTCFYLDFSAEVVERLWVEGRG
ncbi:sensor histidine kinase [Lewinella sp. LCG006]|uniref:sensor histidine kinase n=1 Tax=Lewinella sp. LCG006 TaxID=3231911 RepID=UPI0034606F23